MHCVGVAVDGDSAVGSVKPIILVKRSGKVVELEHEINSMHFILSCSSMMIFAKIVIGHCPITCNLNCSWLEFKPGSQTKNNFLLNVVSTLLLTASSLTNAEEVLSQF